ncbi:MAG: hypothetical protein KAQ63_01885, partial [Candidatus Moranbacteria bacterium]|nr:hypothetical protein [Candidatus Moranbacteria bacterium]
REKKGELEKIKFKNSSKKAEWTKLAKETNKDKIGYLFGNLHIKGFCDITEGGGAKDTPKRIRINPNGLLLGELLFEGYCSESFLKSNFHIYKWGYGVWRTLVSISIFTIIWIFFNSFYQFINIFLK